MNVECVTLFDKVWMVKVASSESQHCFIIDVVMLKEVKDNASTNPEYAFCLRGKQLS